MGLWPVPVLHRALIVGLLWSALGALSGAAPLPGGTYAIISQNGGTYSVDGGAGTKFKTYPNGWYGADAAGGTSANANGTITTTFQWQGSGPTPPYVIVEEDCTAAWSGTGGSADNGFLSGWTPDNEGKSSHAR